ncbi:DUF1905 domain-containing protein, partial [Enterococcus faecium]
LEHRLFENKGCDKTFVTAPYFFLIRISELDENFLELMAFEILA